MQTRNNNNADGKGREREEGPWPNMNYKKGQNLDHTTHPHLKICTTYRSPTISPSIKPLKTTLHIFLVWKQYKYQQNCPYVKYPSLQVNINNNFYKEGEMGEMDSTDLFATPCRRPKAGR